MNDKLLFIDAETDGLYGEFISVGVCVTDAKGKILEEYYIGRDLEQMEITSDWVKENVVPRLGEYKEFATQEDLLNEVWDIWQTNKDATVVGDVIFPVECRLFEETVKLNPEERTFAAPYPLVDVASMLLAKGIDPNISRSELLGTKESEQHNALTDVRWTSRIYQEHILENKKEIAMDKTVESEGKLPNINDIVKKTESEMPASQDYDNQANRDYYAH